MCTDSTGQSRYAISITGCVQGIGMRPYVYRLATHLHLTGWVCNTGQGLNIEVQGLNTAISRFIHTLQQDPPPLAKIITLTKNKVLTCDNEETFCIVESKNTPIHTELPADSGICPDCVADLFDSNSHYHLYPFVSCAQCGPRYTITHTLPYDRCNTTMADFNLCDACLSDYHNVESRRFHAQTTACSQCGPTLSHRFSDVTASITAGNVVAFKGLGGYQLICDAHNRQAISQLRHFKGRYNKPFALMVLNINSAKRFCHVDDHSAATLSSPKRPIVLMACHNKANLAGIAPGLHQLGIMLPTTAAHYLLFYALLGHPSANTDWLHQATSIALVVTSANSQGEPLIYQDHCASDRLKVTTVVSYNRNILHPVDDSVISHVNQQSILLRRARGFTLTPIQLPYAIPETIALGAQKKNTLCITQGDKAYLSTHIGELSHPEARVRWQYTLDAMLTQLAVKPTCIAHDQHPDFYTTQMAHTMAQAMALPCVGIQHQFAHLGAVMVEQPLNTPILGLVCDGYGYGQNGDAWGGELCLIDKTRIKRLSHLHPLILPGGDQVVHEPWRMGVSLLHHMQYNAHPLLANNKARSLYGILQRQINFPTTSSCGRLFDAISALLGICTHASYEGEAPMRMQAYAQLYNRLPVRPITFPITMQPLDMLPAIEYIMHKPTVEAAMLWHSTLAWALAQWVMEFARVHHVKCVMVSGGCFANTLLLSLLKQELALRGFDLLHNHRVPLNDGGISLGQAWLAGRLEQH